MYMQKERERESRELICEYCVQLPSLNEYRSKLFGCWDCSYTEYVLINEKEIATRHRSFTWLISSLFLQFCIVCKLVPLVFGCFSPALALTKVVSRCVRRSRRMQIGSSPAFKKCSQLGPHRRCHFLSGSASAEVPVGLLSGVFVKVMQAEYKVLAGNIYGCNLKIDERSFDAKVFSRFTAVLGQQFRRL